MTNGVTTGSFANTDKGRDSLGTTSNDNTATDTESGSFNGSEQWSGNLGCLPMTLDDYLKRVDWTGRQIRQDKTGHISAECAPILQRLQCDAATWLDFATC